MYVQRYVPHLPAGGEVVIFDRSWYNRAGVERVMGFCTEEQTDRFLELAPGVEKAMVDSGILLLKYWLEVSSDEQTRRLQSRIDDPRKIWKLSDMDLKSYSRWYDYARCPRRDVRGHRHGVGTVVRRSGPTTSGGAASTSSPTCSARFPTSRSSRRRSRCPLARSRATTSSPTSGLASDPDAVLTWRAHPMTDADDEHRSRERPAATAGWRSCWRWPCSCSWSTPR